MSREINQPSTTTQYLNATATTTDVSLRDTLETDLRFFDLSPAHRKEKGREKGEKADRKGQERGEKGGERERDRKLLFEYQTVRWMGV
jgi:hypothetical protein